MCLYKRSKASPALDIEGVTAFEVMSYKELNSETLQDKWDIIYRLGGNSEKFPIDGPINDTSGSGLYF